MVDVLIFWNRLAHSCHFTAKKWRDLPQAHICWERGKLVPDTQAGTPTWPRTLASSFPGPLWLTQQWSIWQFRDFSPLPSKTSGSALTKKDIPDTITRWYQKSKCKTGFPHVPISQCDCMLQITVFTFHCYQLVLFFKKTCGEGKGQM